MLRLRKLICQDRIVNFVNSKFEGSATPREITVRCAKGADFAPLAQLFDQYQQFYRQPPDAALAKRFISERLVSRDSFVAASARHRGMTRALMSAARAHAEATGAARLELATARTSQQAQALYESLGWVRDQEFYRYSLELRG